MHVFLFFSSCRTGGPAPRVFSRLALGLGGVVPRTAVDWGRPFLGNRLQSVRMRWRSIVIDCRCELPTPHYLRLHCLCEQSHVSEGRSDFLDNLRSFWTFRIVPVSRYVSDILTLNGQNESKCPKTRNLQDRPSVNRTPCTLSRSEKMQVIAGVPISPLNSQLKSSHFLQEI